MDPKELPAGAAFRLLQNGHALGVAGRDVCVFNEASVPAVARVHHDVSRVDGGLPGLGRGFRLTLHVDASPEFVDVQAGWGPLLTEEGAAAGAPVQLRRGRPCEADKACSLTSFACGAGFRLRMGDRFLKAEPGGALVVGHRSPALTDDAWPLAYTFHLQRSPDPPV